MAQAESKSPLGKHTVLILLQILDLIDIAIGAGDFVAYCGLRHSIRLTVISAGRLLHSRCGSWGLAGIGLVTLHLDTAIDAIPVDIETDCFTNVPEHDIVVAVDRIGSHLDLLAINEELVVAQIGDDARCVCCGAAEEHRAEQKSGKKGTDSLHVLSPHQVYFSSHSLRGDKKDG